jgi:hypothetical protein
MTQIPAPPFPLLIIECLAARIRASSGGGDATGYKKYQTSSFRVLLY